MYLIPEISTVVILTPRTGSGSLKRAIKAKYPEAMMIYRHMEADGIPAGYDTWQKVGVIRHPVARLWSLYKFLQTFDDLSRHPHDPAYLAAQWSSVQRPFSEWIVENEVVFTSPYDSAGRGRFWPQYNCNHPLPENKKSQYLTLRPDLGTAIYQFEDIKELGKTLHLELGHVNETPQEPWPELTSAARAHVEQWFEWDLRHTAHQAY